MKVGTALLGSLTIPGRPDRVAEARAFVTRALGSGCACTDTAVLLTSELVTNSVRHSDSSQDGGTVTVTVSAIPGGIRIDVADAGGPTVPAVRQNDSGEPAPAEYGRGLFLVELLSDRWDYHRTEDGAVTWFELPEAPVPAAADLSHD